MTISANTRPRVVVLLTAVALALALLLVLSVTAMADDAAADPVGADTATTIHVVRSGDTLWDIAVGVAAPGADVRNVVEDIKRASGLQTSLILPGQVLIVPVAG
jgi:nucleoid-associated protein YgaU